MRMQDRKYKHVPKSINFTLLIKYVLLVVRVLLC